MTNVTRLSVIKEPDVVAARSAGRELAKALGFSTADQTRLATAISELTRNILRYAGEGACEINSEAGPNRTKITVVVEDHGPGIADIDAAMKDGFTTGGGLGAGLPGTRRLVHEFEIVSRPGHTRIVIGMLLPPNRHNNQLGKNASAFRSPSVDRRRRNSILRSS